MYDPKAWCQFAITITREPDLYREATTGAEIAADEEIADEVRKWLEEVGTRLQRKYPGLYFSKVDPV